MQKELTILLDEQTYAGLHALLGKEQISPFIESILKPHVVPQDLYAAYREMAQDEAQEAEALEWAEATIGDVADGTW